MLNTSRNYIGDKIYLLVVFPSFYLIDDDNNVDNHGHNDNNNDKVIAMMRGKSPLLKIF